MIRRLLAAALMVSLAAVTILISTEKAHGATIVLEGTIGKIKLKPANTYLLRGGVFINKKLVCKPGVRVFGLPGSFLVINRGARLIAQGTPEAPIVFTSAAPEGTRRRGDWGGIIFNGRAPINVPGGEGEGEGDTGRYGGGANPDPNDFSGILRYVRVEYGGFPISPDNELNCVAFQGVGNTTEVDNLAALWGGDDGIEMFGGTIDLRHIVAIGASDDSIDWTEGWNGRVQFAVVQQRGDEADNGFECDNSAENHNLLPRSAPRMANVTVIGAPSPDQGPGSTRGMLLRVGTWGQFRNFIVMGFKNVGLEVRDAATFAGFENGGLELRSMIFFDNRGNNPNIASGATTSAVTDFGQNIMVGVDPLLMNPYDTEAPDFRPQAGSPALVSANVAPLFNDPFFAAAPYVGAFGGGASDNWLAGWLQYVFGN
jgi:hypothetical protein